MAGRKKLIKKIIIGVLMLALIVVFWEFGAQPQNTLRFKIKYYFLPKIWEGWFEFEKPPILNHEAIIMFYLRAEFKNEDALLVKRMRPYPIAVYDFQGEIICKKTECLHAKRKMELYDKNVELVCPEGKNSMFVPSYSKVPQCLEWNIKIQKGKTYAMELSFIPRKVGYQTLRLRGYPSYFHPSGGAASTQVYFDAKYFVTQDDTRLLNRLLLGFNQKTLSRKQRR